MPTEKIAADIQAGDLIHADGMSALTVTDTWPAQTPGDYTEIDVCPTPGEDPWNMGPAAFARAAGAERVECFRVVPKPVYRLYYQPAARVQTPKG